LVYFLTGPPPYRLHSRSLILGYRVERRRFLIKSSKKEDVGAFDKSTIVSPGAESVIVSPVMAF
jgi:hypothetical protein